VPLPGAVLYELHIGTFTPGGTFDAAVERLDHLVELGVSAVELLPCNGFAGRWGWGYDGVAWFAVHEPYGGPEGLKRFVDACHARGLGVVMDVVYNHFGPAGTTCRSSARTSPSSTRRPGARPSTWTGPARTRSAATSSTTR
jgi:maltooligosyltrehalose trehalohydrolase